MYKLTIDCSDLKALAFLVDRLMERDEAAPATPTPAAAAKLKKIKAVEPVVEIAEEETSEVTYDQVKNAVLAVAKKLGREASLDLLSDFGVVSGEGNERKGNISDLKPEQYAAVIDAANKKFKD